ncbi:MAG TPA: hypothetical protein PKC86_01080 [Candidatus Saccharibacteria bacterium]|nr:hypothetical protein [Candidatus Saccharibacteria bacterium]
MKLSIVSYLDDDSMAIVRGVQEELSEITGSKASLELWQPHITVGDGVEVNDDEFIKLRYELDDAAAKTTRFNVDLYDIIKHDSRVGGSGEETTPYGLYLDVRINDNLLELVANISNSTKALSKWYFMPKPYHPHCALAFKDLSKEGFERGIAFLDTQDLKLNVSLDHFSLVEMLPSATREIARFNLLNEH